MENFNPELQGIPSAEQVDSAILPSSLKPVITFSASLGSSSEPILPPEKEPVELAALSSNTLFFGDSIGGTTQTESQVLRPTRAEPAATAQPRFINGLANDWHPSWGLESDPLLGNLAAVSPEAAVEYPFLDRTEELLSQALSVATASLKEFASAQGQLASASEAFGDSVSIESLKEAIASVVSGKTIPAIEIVAETDLGANGAFSQQTNTIFLSREFLEQNAENLAVIASVLLEEIGHYLDSKFNAVDSPGDEGAIFAAIVKGIKLSKSERLALKAENDATSLTLNGQVLLIEQSSKQGGLDLINGLGGTAGFGENVLNRNDDRSSSFIDVTAVFESGLNFFGTTYNGFYINNNGNITFTDSLSTYSPFYLNGDTGIPIIAPFFTDIDTRAGVLTPSPEGNSTGSNLVYWDLDPANNTVIVTWDDVGEYLYGTTPNAFQLRLQDLGNGNFTIEYRYEDIQWYRGDARAGYSAANGLNFFELPQSGTSAMLDLETTSNTNQPGRFIFSIVNGIPNQPPTNINLSGSNVNENSPNSTVVGSLTTTDPDAGDLHTYTLVNNAGGRFALNNQQIVVADGSLLDFETNSHQTIVVRTTDAGGLTYEKSLVITVNDVDEPDLQFSNVSVSESVVSPGETLQLNWTIINQGVANTFASWVDSVYLSDDAILDQSDLLLTSQAGEPLSIGSSYSRNQNITISRNQLEGTYYLLLATDRNKNQIEANETNNIYALNLKVKIPDLTISDTTVPPSVGLGETVDISWTVTNTGIGRAAADWTDAVYLSSDQTLDASDRLLSRTSIAAQTPLEAGRNYVIHQNVSFPTNITIGNYYLLFATDKNDNQQETSESNNLLARPIQLTAPNLTVASISVPNSGVSQPGQTIEVNWTLKNTGTGTAAGTWVDRIYLSPDGTLESSIFVKDVIRTLSLGVEESYTGSTQIVVPDLADGNYRLLVVTDTFNQLLESPTGETNNQGTSAIFEIAHPDLVSLITAPLQVTSGTTIPLTWRTTNTGTAPTLSTWSDRIYLSTDTIFDATDLLLGQFNATETLAAQASNEAQISWNIPLELSGNFHLLVVTDASNTIKELGAENNNVTTSSAFEIQLAPYADLAVSSVIAPALTLGDPASVEIGWTVTNIGTGKGRTDQWRDLVILSKDEIVGNGDDRVIMQYIHTGGLDVGESYEYHETILLPPAFEGHYRLFVSTDADKIVFENNLETNNLVSASNFFDVVPIPYADLVIPTLTTDSTARSSDLLTVSWSVKNQGIGITNTSSWTDRLFLASDAEGKNIVADLGSFERAGSLAVGDTYQRSVSVLLPNGLNGTYYVAASTSGPKEFIYTSNNSRVSEAFEVSLTPPPDLKVTDLIAPSAIEAGRKIDFSWTIINDGTGKAAGAWVDEIYLQAVGPNQQPLIWLGSFTYDRGLAVGQSYTRKEQIAIPSTLQGLYQIVVKTNTSNSLYEHSATGNNIAVDNDPLLINLPPRPDLQVQLIEAPQKVNAGGTAALTFVVLNQGTVPTTTPWQDRIYLSLDNKISSDDFLLGSPTNESALAPQESYRSSTLSFVVPKRFRGEVFLIVQANADGKVNEYPQDGNNTLAVPLNVVGLPLADLVTGNVIAPNQAFEGSTIPIRYTVTNKGIGETDRDEWTDTIWLTKDKKRPSPVNDQGGIEDILLAQITHSGSLPVGNSYEQIINVTLPEQVTGEWYITPWSDTYDIVLEDTFALNINPDDPNELDNNNYKAYPLKILLTSPADLVVTNVTPTAQGRGGEPFQVTWTVQNQGNRDIVNQSWVDTIYLSDRPTLNDPNAKKWILGKVKQSSHLGAGQSETFTLETILSPAADGQYIIVQTNSEPPTLWEGPYTDNNERTAVTNVIRMPADLIVSSILAPASSFSGEPVDLSWTVTNVGAPMWSGTKYWYDEVWVSPDPTFIPERATKVGSFIYSPQQPLVTGDNYTQTQKITLPRGIQGNYYIYVRTNSQGDLVATGGNKDNQGSLKYFIERGFEDPANNLSRTILPVIYHEPDLQVSHLVVPATVPPSGQSIPVSWTVTNTGTRATRENRWDDRIYLSRDPSLDMSDSLLGEFERRGVLGLGESYEGHLNLTLPEGISGDFYLLVFSDANLVDVNDGNCDEGAPPGSRIYFERITSRTLARVPEFFDEGNNVTAAFLPIILREPPDLRVTSLLVPERATIGQSFNLTYTVSNKGTGDTPASQANWTDLIYLSRDQFFDPQSDIYLDSIYRNGGLIKDDSYTITKTLPIPTYLSGPFYAFVVTDYGQLSGGNVFESNLESNNATSSTQPIIFDFAPPSDLQVDQILSSATAHSGDTVAIQWTVTNRGDNAARGQWSDAVYLSSDNVWDINDPLVGRLSFNGILEKGQSYTQNLETFLPPALPGQYRLIGRPDIYNQIYEATNEANNFTTSANPLNVVVEELSLGVPLPTHLSAGQSRLYQVKLNAGQTFKVSLDSSSSETQNAFFLRYNNLPTGTAYDATNTEELGPDPSVVISATETGVYYILVRSVFGSSPATIKAELLSFGITDVMTDRGGDSRYVTTNILGAQFQPDALVKLVRPGIAELLPVRYQVLDSTKITAIFDLTDAPHGLYDVKVINPNGSEAIVPYRYLVERTIEPDVNLGLGGSRVLAPGETGTYGIAVKSLTNIDTPYVHFQFGIPELGNNQFLLSKFDEAVKQAVGISKLPYVQFTSNLRGQPPQGATDLPWASLISDLNTDGEILAPGYLFDLPTAEAVGRTFNVLTYPQLQELLKLQPDALNDLLPEEESKIAFRFHIQGAATVLTRDEFIAQQRIEALRLRSAILKDRTASLALTVLAANENTWVTAYLAALEEAGLLRPENEAPPVRQDPLVVSLIATLASGLLVGPVGEQILTNGNLVNFFTQIRRWYGHNSDLIGQAEVPDATEYDLQQAKSTHYAAFNIYIPYGKARYDLPGGATVPPPNFANFFSGKGTVGELGSLLGPVGALSEGYIPLGQPLPYTIQFENASTAASAVGEVRIVTQLDADLDPRSFRLGDLRLGDLQINIPDGRSFFQGDFDFRTSKGFILRVSAGLDPLSNTATWLLSALDPLTGEVIQDPGKGLLPPNDVTGVGRGFVTYTVQLKPEVPTGTEITSTARILYNTSAPLDTATLTNLVDAVAPTTSVKVTPLVEGRSDYLVQWTATDDEMGSGAKHVTVYVSENGGNFTIWKRQTTDTEGVFLGKSGSTYEFLALATDEAGNTEKPKGITVPDDGSSPDLGSLPSLDQTSEPPIQPASGPNPDAVPNNLFIIASQNIPNLLSPIQPSEFEQVLRPFTAQAFATGIPISHAQIGPMAIVILEDGSVIASGGVNRGSLFKIPQTGGTTNLLAELAHPVFDLALAPNGQLWAVTGGGPLLQLDAEGTLRARTTGAIFKQYGDGITQSLAINAQTGQIYVSSGNGIEIFDPLTETFTHFSDHRVGNLAFAPDGTLWGVRWPERGEIVRFDETGKAQLMLDFDLPVDSLAFGQPNTRLAGLLFVSSNNGELLMVDLATRQFITVASGGSRGDIVETTADGRVLLSQSHQIDVLNPLFAPQVVFTNPAPDAIVALPNSTLTVTFNSDMLVGSGTEAFSVLNPFNYKLIRQTTPISVSDEAIIGPILSPSALPETNLASPSVPLASATSDEPNYALELEDGDIITHNRFLVPDWGVLRFDLRVPELTNGTVSVSMQSDIPNFEDYELGTINLTAATGTPSQYLDDRYKIGFGTQGFETFHLNIPDALRGKMATLTFEVDGGTVYLDNVFFKSEHLLLGNPTFNGQEARANSTTHANNYLIEKPQYSLSYNSSTKTPNWVSYKFDSTWLGNLRKLGNSYWRADSEIPFEFPKTEPDNYKSSGYEIGHMATESHLKRTRKDQFATYLLTNALPQHRDNNSDFDPGDVINPPFTSAWINFEYYLKDLVEKENKELYIISGGLGSLNDEIDPNNPLVLSGVNIPSATWKVAVVLEPGQNLSDITTDTRVISVVTPNIERPKTLDPDPTLPETDKNSVNYWRYWGNWRYSVDFIEEQTGLNLLSNIPKEIQDALEFNPDDGATTTIAFSSGFPLVSQVGSTNSETAFNTSETSTDHNSVVQLGMIQVGESQISPTQVGTREINEVKFSPTQVSPAQISITQVTANGIVSPSIATQISPTQVNITQIGSPQVEPLQLGIPQINSAQIDPSKISFASSITPQQLLSSHNATSDETNYIIPQTVRYDAATRTAYLTFDALEADRYELQVSSQLQSNAGIALEQAYQVDFTAVSDFTPFVDLQLINTRSERATQTISFDVSLTNKTAYDLQLPLALLLDPTPTTTGLPQGATQTENGYYLIDLSQELPDGRLRPGQSITDHTVIIYNPDALRFDFEPAILTLPYANAAPIFSSTPITTAVIGQPYTAQISAIDPDGSLLGYLLYTAPQGMSLDPVTGVISWIPTANSPALAEVVLQAYDTRGGRSTQSFTINVAGGNQKPVFAPLPDLIRGQEGQPLVININATDPESSSLLYWADHLPSGAWFDSIQRTFNWTPDFVSSGTYENVTFIVSDGLEQTIQKTTLLIAPSNQKPTLLRPIERTIIEGDSIRLQLQGSDPDGQKLSYFGNLLPGGSQLDPNTGIFTWTPTYFQAGVHEISFSVSDGEYIRPLA